MMKSIIATALIGASLSANERLSQLKAAIVRSDDQAVQQLLQQGALAPKESSELCGWADDTIEERRLLDTTTGEALGFILGAAGLGMAAVAGLGYAVGDVNVRAVLKKMLITTDTRAALAVAGCTMLCYYGITSGSRGAKRRLNKALTIKDILEQQLVLYRKEDNHE